MLKLADLRRFAVARSLFPPTTLARALSRMRFVQADPIRAPARAQDLTLRHRAAGYRAGDLERLYPSLGIEEDVFINYGFVTRDVSALMHPRKLTPAWPAGGKKRTQDLLTFVSERGSVHPREAHERFAHGTVTNYWGGSSNATTHLLEALHYRGWLRVTRRERGIRLYALRDTATPEAALSPRERVDALVDVVVNKYAPLPALSLSYAVRRLRYAVPQWKAHIPGALVRARRRLRHEQIDGVDWFWPEGETVTPGVGLDDKVRLLAPFDPVVWDRRRFELFWGWPYRFEAYTPVSQRKFGYYALPLLWRSRVIGWANLSVVAGALNAGFGYVAGRPRDRVFTRELDAELARVRHFLRID